MSRGSRKPEKVGTILKSLLKDLGWEKGILQHEVILAWAEIVGKEIARKTTPIRVRGSKLFVEVEGSSWMQHLHYLKPAILSKLNERIKPNHSNRKKERLIKEIVLLCKSSYEKRDQK